MSNAELIKRYSFFIIGLFFSALGITLITKAGTGTSPISSVPYVLCFIFPLTFGQFTFIVNMLMIIGQIFILKNNFQKVQLLQVPMTIIFGFSIDFTMFLFNFVHPDFYLLKIIILLSGAIILGIGIAMQVRANVIILPGEGLVKAISTVFRKEFGTVKTLFDISLVCISIMLSLCSLARIAGLREGTIISALIVGSLVRFFLKRFEFMEKVFVNEQENAAS
jgi:uncharacterized protein